MKIVSYLMYESLNLQALYYFLHVQNYVLMDVKKRKKGMDFSEGPALFACQIYENIF